MGVPKFFKWLAERYPCIVSPFIDATLPSIDNLYLDMNGIIHNCTHTDDPSSELSDKESMLRIFQYIDRLFDTVKPRKYFFMAIDGVAPRAKMNQQRSRRFRSAFDKDQLVEQIKAKGEEPPQDLFDSNCITPGTEFMARLSDHLQYFIRKKMQEDIRWQQCKVIFSGHDVPGEGEHKIMSFIRKRKTTEKDYSPNETHCLYGLDADLIMLGLMTHEPHFILLREDVFGQFNRKKGAKAEDPTERKFQLLHVGMLREYLHLEFHSIFTKEDTTNNAQQNNNNQKNNKNSNNGRGYGEKTAVAEKAIPSFAYDLERVIDDFILICYLCGNDFLPHMPTLDIREDSIGALFDVYREVMPTLDGYLTDEGMIIFERFEKYVALVGERESDMLAVQAHNLAVKSQNKRKTHRRKRRVVKIVEEHISQTETGSTQVKVRMTDASMLEQHILTAEGAISLQNAAAIDSTSASTTPLSVASPTTSVQTPSADAAMVAHAEHAVPIDDLEVKKMLKEQQKLVDEERGALSESDAAFASMMTLGDVATDVVLAPDQEPASMYEYEDEEDEEQEDPEKVELLLAAYRTGGIFEFNTWHKNYYKRKFGIDFETDPEADKKCHQIVVHYVEGLQWVYNYYYKNCVSWKWFFPYNYSPICSDLKNLAVIAKQVNFDLGKPFTPFQQLLSVLPPRSHALLPRAYQPLVLDENSPIADFYPTKFGIDREGTRYEYEGVVILPFIDEDRLFAAMNTVDQSLLTAEERRRNGFGTEYLFTHVPAQGGKKEDDDFKPYDYMSTLPGELPDVVKCRTKAVPFEASEVTDSFVFRPRLCDKVQMGASAPEGFASLLSKRIYRASPKPIGLTLFGHPSRRSSMVIEFKNDPVQAAKDEADEENEEDAGDAAVARYIAKSTTTPVDASNGSGSGTNAAEQEKQVDVATPNEKVVETAAGASKLLGERVYIGYPFPRLAEVASISDRNVSMYFNGGEEAHTEEDARNFEREAEHHKRTLLRRYALDVDEVTVLVYVHLFDGMKKNKKGDVVKSFTEEEFAFPYQLLVDPTLYKPQLDDKFRTKRAVPIDKEYPRSSRIIILNPGDANAHLTGEKAVVIGYSADKKQLKVALERDQTVKSAATSTPATPTTPTGGASTGTAAANAANSVISPTLDEIVSLIPASIHAYVNQKYYPLAVAAKKLGMSPRNLGLVIGMWSVRDSRGKNRTIGLNLRDTKRDRHVVGYARHDNSNQTLDETYFLNFSKHSFASSISKFSIEGQFGWELSDLAITLIDSYKREFPELFVELEKDSDVSDIMSKVYHHPHIVDKKVRAIVDWVDKQEFKLLPVMPCKTKLLPADYVRSLEQNFIDYAPQQKSTTAADVAPLYMAPGCVYHPPDPFPRKMPSFKRESYDIGHHVVNLSGSGQVPFGLSGIIVGIDGLSASVVFPVEFIGGTTLNGQLKTYRGQTLPLEALLNLTALRTEAGNNNQQVSAAPGVLKTESMQRTQFMRREQRVGANGRTTDLRENYGRQYYTVERYNENTPFTPIQHAAPRQPGQQQQKPIKFDFSRDATTANNNNKQRGRGPKERGAVSVQNAFNELSLNEKSAMPSKPQQAAQEEKMVEKQPVAGSSPAMMQQGGETFDPAAFFMEVSLRQKEQREEQQKQRKLPQQQQKEEQHDRYTQSDIDAMKELQAQFVEQRSQEKQKQRKQLKERARLDERAFSQQQPPMYPAGYPPQFGVPPPMGAYPPPYGVPPMAYPMGAPPMNVGAYPSPPQFHPSQVGGVPQAPVPQVQQQKQKQQPAAPAAAKQSGTSSTNAVKKQGSRKRMVFIEEKSEDSTASNTSIPSTPQ